MSVITNVLCSNCLYKDIHSFAFTSAKFIKQTSQKIKSCKNPASRGKKKNHHLAK